MRRLLLVFLSILLPLQFAWAGAAAYCAHESADQPAAMTSHFGHHTHEHGSDAHKASKTAGKAAAKSANLPDGDCTACHFPGSHGVFAEFRMPGDYRYVTLRYQPRHFAFGSIPAPVPDRPQWLRLA
ncbi:cation efflux protein, CzcI family [Cupriavidus pauculus]|uniref:Heavy metal resistance regulator n=1 Tax=Cupriavidus pauculus TaxID=82633 RepID=A0A2N5C2Y3_9BURK|nr:cation efflux protein, CzcI family [Cupriavidus pauculus]PLP96540.1 heavy metal resistance regulator [Cupriavidus pauculus]